MSYRATLRDALHAIPGVEAAMIHGSWATRQVTPTSDIDVLVVVADDAPASVVDAVRGVARSVEQLIGRDVDTSVFTRVELRLRIEAGSGFVRDVLDGPRIELFGSAPTLDPDEARSR